MSAAPSPAASVRCPNCGTEVAERLLACPGCNRLVQRERLKSLLAEATDAERDGDESAAREALHAMLALLPPESKQYTMVAAKLAALSPPADRSPSPSANSEPQSRVWKWIVGLGPLGALAWKLKFAAVALLSNGKLLLLGLTKATTLYSMLLAFGLYWTAWGMWFALGFVLSIYVHEMGHVVALRRYGIPATAPMFIPGLGAFIGVPRSLPAVQNAQVGLAGPMWGLAAAVTAWLASLAGGGPLWMAIARTGAWINLFNLLPVWQLDGNRGFSALGRLPRGTIAAAFGLSWMLTGNGLLALLAIVSAWRALDRHASEPTDARAWLTFIGLVAGLTVLLYLTGTPGGTTVPTTTAQVP